MSAPQVILTNPRRGGAAFTLARGLAVVALWLPLPAALAAAIWASSFMDRVPPVPELPRHPPGAATEIYGTDGTRLGGLTRGQRPFTPIEAIPARVQVAFLAAEDDAFFEHGGFDAVAIARAFLRNREAGRVVEGGSTITQQIAKDSISRARSYERKILELLLARRIEARYTKHRILEDYLNHVYLGAGATGVVAAAEIYFGKDLNELSWAEAALLAGMTNSPSQRSPFRHPDRALARRDAILQRLGAIGALTPEEVEAAQGEALALREGQAGDADTAPYPVVAAREALRAEQGDDAIASGGFRLTLAVHPWLQARAQESLQRSMRDLDQRQGWRGPVTTLPEARWDAFAAATRDTYALPPSAEPWSPTPGRLYLALVREVAADQALVEVGGRPITLGGDAARWAAAYDPKGRRNEQRLDDYREALHPGDVVFIEHGSFQIWDRPPEQRGRRDEARAVEGWRLSQAPKVEGALLSAEIDTGYVRALVGGYDFDRSEFNRATDACRQPGSTFKPVVYSRALQEGMTPATVLTDAPTKILKAGGEVWTPKNADRKFQGFLLLRDALARSRNLPAVEVFNFVGPHAVVDQAKRLGITTEMKPTESLALGASCVTPWDMTRVYGTFARRGVRMEPHLVLTVSDMSGEIISDHGHFADPSAPLLGRLARLALRAHERPPRVLDEITAYQMLHLLSAVVYAGTAYSATALGFPVAGKTGTTNAYDAWFTGFSRSLVTVVWVGADGNERALGARETGGRVALPAFVRFMSDALAGRPQGAIIGPAPEGVDLQRIDRDLGLLAAEDEPGLDLPFREGTAPSQVAPDRTYKQSLKVDQSAAEF